MHILYWLSSIRSPFLNEVMLLITQLGEETVFLVISLLLFWCVDKKRGYYVLCIGFAGTLLNHFMKIVCQVPRPWVKDSDFAAVAEAKESAGGYSFPSGHTQTAVGTFGAIARCHKNRVIRILCFFACIAVPFSRMYLGVHTLSDVLVGAGISLALIWGFHSLCFTRKNSPLLPLMGIITVLSGLFLLFVELYPFPENVDATNLLSAQKNAYTLLFCMLGLIVTYVVDEKWTHFSVNAVWWSQILKVLIGGVLVFAVKSGLKAPLEMLFNGHMIARGVRYFLIVVTAGVLWPMTFRWFSKLGSSTWTGK